MQKRDFLKTVLATTMLAGLGWPAFAETAWDGPTSGPAAADGKTVVGEAVMRFHDDVQSGAFPAAEESYA